MMTAYSPILLQCAPILVTGLLTFATALTVNRLQARGAAGGRRDARVEALEGALERANTALADARDRHITMIEKMLAEEEELRDQHAAKIAETRARADEARLQAFALREALLRRGVDPEHVLTAAAV